MLSARILLPDGLIVERHGWNLKVHDLAHQTFADAAALDSTINRAVDELDAERMILQFAKPRTSAYRSPPIGSRRNLKTTDHCFLTGIVNLTRGCLTLSNLFDRKRIEIYLDRPRA